jgi:hypothetical protein
MEHVDIGTSNAVIQLQDNYVELVGDLEQCRDDELKSHLSNWTRYGDGYWATSLNSLDLEADRQHLASQGLETTSATSAKRRVRVPGHGWMDTASAATYCWNHSSLATSLFLTCHKRPGTIWFPQGQRHLNGAQRVVRVSYAVKNPIAHARYFDIMLGQTPIQTDPDHHVWITPRNERLELQVPQRVAVTLPGARQLPQAVEGMGVGLTVLVRSLQHVEYLLSHRGIDVNRSEDRLIVSSGNAAGIAIDFIEHELGEAN